jgi:hypothetical protein
MTRRPASAARPVYRVKAQPAGEGGYAVLRGGVEVLGDLHRSLASAMAHDLNAAVGSGRVYRCGPPSAAYECKVMASDGTKMKTPRVYISDANDLVAHLNHAATTGASRANPSPRRGVERLYWQWSWRGGEKGRVFSLPATLRTERDMRQHHRLVVRGITQGADWMHPPKPERIEIQPHRFILGRTRDTDEITGWSVTEDGEPIGFFDLVRSHRPNPSRPAQPRMPRLTRADYRALLAHATDWIGATDNPGDPITLSVGKSYSVPDLVGGTQVEFRSDAFYRGFYYPLSAATLKRRAAAK